MHPLSPRTMCLLVYFLGGFSTGAAAEPARPNILFCFADDWGKFASRYSQVDGPGTVNDLIQTPHIDRVAKNGVLFQNAYVNSPSCTPCRSAILSGQYFWRTGRAAILQGARWDSSIPAFPLVLRDNGYHIGKMYKVWGPGTPADATFGEQAYSYESAGRRINQFSQNVTRRVEQGIPLKEAKEEIYGEVRTNFRQFLKARPAGAPFCFWYGPTNVHRKWVKGSGRALWNLEPSALKGKMPPFIPDVPEVREDFADYMGEAMAFDASVGVLLNELAESGELANTLVVISGDHGPPGFPHGKCNLYDFGTNVTLAIQGPGVAPGRVVNDFVNLMDLAPTFLESGNVAVPNVMTGRSLWPVLKSTREGWVDESRTFVVTGRERHVAAARDQNLPYPQRAIRTRDYLYIVNFHPERWPLGNPYRLDAASGPSVEELTEDTMVTLMDEDAGPTKAWLVTHRDDPEIAPYFQKAYGKRSREELYILKDDPFQMQNVVHDPSFGLVRERLQKELMALLDEAGDPRLVDNGRYFETTPLSDPFQPPARNPRPLQK